MKQGLLIVVALLLFAIAFIALLPHTAVSLLANASNMYSVGLTVDAKGQIVLLGIGIMAALGRVWS